jgi:hypothetical protein
VKSSKQKKQTRIIMADFTYVLQSQLKFTEHLWLGENPAYQMGRKHPDDSNTPYFPILFIDTFETLPSQGRLVPDILIPYLERPAGMGYMNGHYLHRPTTRYNGIIIRLIPNSSIHEIHDNDGTILNEARMSWLQLAPSPLTICVDRDDAEQQLVYKGFVSIDFESATEYIHHKTPKWGVLKNAAVPADQEITTRNTADLIFCPVTCYIYFTVAHPQYFYMRSLIKMPLPNHFQMGEYLIIDALGVNPLRTPLQHPKTDRVDFFTQPPNGQVPEPVQISGQWY